VGPERPLKHNICHRIDYVRYQAFFDVGSSNAMQVSMKDDKRWVNHGFNAREVVEVGGVKGE